VCHLSCSQHKFTQDRHVWFSEGLGWQKSLLDLQIHTVLLNYRQRRNNSLLQFCVCFWKQKRRFQNFVFRMSLFYISKSYKDRWFSEVTVCEQDGRGLIPGRGPHVRLCGPHNFLYPASTRARISERPECEDDHSSSSVSEITVRCFIKSLEQSPPWKANSRSASQETPLLLWNYKGRYRIHKSPPLVPTLSQINPVPIIRPYCFTIYLNIILAGTPVD
jgi:hypothetical protein